MNAELFRRVFGIDAIDVWKMPEEDFLKWLSNKPEHTDVLGTLGDGTLIVTVKKGTEVGRVFVEEEGSLYGNMFYPEEG